MHGNLLNDWLDSRFLPGLELITTYVDDVERECKHSIETFKASDDGYEQQVGLDEAGNEVMHWVQVHKGLSDNAWCLPEIFEHYFPTLKRRAALAVLCGHMEHELNELCREVERQLVVTVSFDDMKGQGVTRATLYLRKIGNVILDTGKDPEWKKMAEAFQVRNSMVHAGGRAEKTDVVTDHAVLYERFFRNDCCVLAGKFSVTGVFTLCSARPLARWWHAVVPGKASS